MKRHAKHLTLGGVIVPIILALCALIGNAAQTAIGLDLHGTALAIFLVGFLAGSTVALHGSMKLEAAQLASEFDVGKVLGDLGGALFGGPQDSSPPAEPSPLEAKAEQLPPPPAPPAS